MEYAAVTLRKGEGRYLKAGGLWVYDNEIGSVEGSVKDGGIVKVLDHDGYFLGYGFINSASTIRVRMMSRGEDVPVDSALLERRLRSAWEYRKKTVDTGCCRIVFGEADLLPGIVIDKFSDVLVVESLALGIDLMKPDIVRILKDILAEDGIIIRGVYERSDARVRELEGMERYKGFIGPEFDTTVQIVENDVKYYVDVKDGQKTGFFLDQKLNRRRIHRIAKDADVLDCFTHTGSFALNAAVHGARHVTAVDASDIAIKDAERNAELNGVSDICDFICDDVFDLLPRFHREGRTFDLVILDPPAFTKSRSSVKKAVKGYREINMAGMRLIRDGGFLATCSCSHFMEPELFSKTIAEAARSVHRRLRQVEFGTQSPDHPILWGADDSYYLKFYVFQIFSGI
ncbi:MAG: class I SAM-dependent rRNA methyltransferase [Lachnospiraceae bacterium]|nr:class I SAM-dependent rRNA methyltransferase [Lachnospiraceae bacterium]